MHLEINNSTLVLCTPCLFDLRLNCFSNLFGCEKKGGAENERKEMWAILLRIFYFIILWMNVLVNVFFIASMCRLERQKKKKKKIHCGPPHDVVDVQFLVSKEDESGAENERKEMWAILFRIFYFIILWMNVLVNVFFIASIISCWYMFLL